MPELQTIPKDATLLPLFDGQLLVSRDQAVFCRVPSDEVAAAREVLEGRADLSALSPELRAELERHGFFGEPRPLEPDKPSVQLQLTNDCNLACTYCCTNSGHPRAEELTFERAAAVVREARELLGEGGQVAILGGEPFLQPWAMDLAELIVDLGQQLTIFTNGTVHANDDELCRRTAELNRRGAEVRISLAGATAELCDAASKAPRFFAALEGIKRIHSHGGRVIVDLMCLPQQIDELAESFHDLRGELPPDTPISLGILYLSGREQGQHLFATRSELESALDRIAFEAGETISAPALAPVTWRREGCGCAFGNHLHVRSDGGLFSCFKMEEKVGQLGEVGFVETGLQLRANPHPASTLKTCADCPLATLCGGGCRSDNLLYTGEADGVVCDSWRVRVMSELLAEDRVTAVDWPVPHLLAEAHARGIAAPPQIVPVRTSRHLLET